ncbi:hypothetical protein BGX21_004257, partial [Mortierella sp. AD011]
MQTPSTNVSSAASPTTSIASKHPYKEPKQVEALAGLRELLGPSNENYDDGELMRFIVARSYDL